MTDQPSNEDLVTAIRLARQMAIREMADEARKAVPYSPALRPVPHAPANRKQRRATAACLKVAAKTRKHVLRRKARK